MARLSGSFPLKTLETRPKASLARRLLYVAIMTGLFASRTEQKALDRLGIVALLFALLVASLFSVEASARAFVRVLAPVSGAASDAPAEPGSASSLRGDTFQ